MAFSRWIKIKTTYMHIFKYKPDRANLYVKTGESYIKVYIYINIVLKSMLLSCTTLA